MSLLSHFCRVDNFRHSHRGREIVEVVNRRVLAAYFNEALGLITCEKALLGQTAKEETSLRSCRRDSDSLKDSTEMEYSVVSVPEKVWTMMWRMKWCREVSV